MSEVSRGEILDIIARFAARNRFYREALLENPRAVLEKQMNRPLPEHFTVKVVEETADTVYLVVPYVPEDGDELSDLDLERVTGGKGSKGGHKESGQSYTCNDATGIATRTEVGGV